MLEGLEANTDYQVRIVSSVSTNFGSLTATSQAALFLTRQQGKQRGSPHCVCVCVCTYALYGPHSIGGGTEGAGGGTYPPNLTVMGLFSRPP